MTYFENKNESLGDRMRRKSLTAPGMPAPVMSAGARSQDERANEASFILTGDLSEKPIPWLLMMAEGLEVTGRLQVGLAACPVVIHFGLGRPVHAQSPFCSGVEAVMDLFIWKDGKVKFEPGGQTDSVTIQQTAEELIARGEEYAYNREYLQQHGITELSFLVRPPARHAVGEVERRIKDGQPLDPNLQMEFFSNTYGTRNIKDTAEKLSLSPSQWVSIAANLLQLGILLAPDGRSIATEDSNVNGNSNRNGTGNGNGNGSAKAPSQEFAALHQPGPPQPEPSQPNPAQPNPVQPQIPAPLRTASVPPENPFSKILQQTKSSLPGEVTQSMSTVPINESAPVRKQSRLGEITMGMNVSRLGEVTQGINIAASNDTVQSANPPVVESVIEQRVEPKTTDSQPKVKLSRLGEITQGMNVAALHERIRSQSLAQTISDEANKDSNAISSSPSKSQTGFPAAPAPSVSQTGLPPAVQAAPSPSASQAGLPAAMPSIQSPSVSQTGLTPPVPATSSPSSSQTGMPSASPFGSLADVSTAMMSSKQQPSNYPRAPLSGEITANMSVPAGIDEAAIKPQLRTPQAKQEMTINPGSMTASGLPGHIVLLDQMDHNRILKLLSSPETGIFTFDALQFFLAREFERACRFKSLLTLALFSIRSNDDSVVSPEVATLITATVSRIKRDVDIFGHFGSRAYAILLPSVDSNQACLLVDRINKDLVDMSADLKEFNVSLHFGLATVPQDAAELNGLVKSAQVAMFHAATNRILSTQAVQLRK